jgi:hypothetical protein
VKIFTFVTQKLRQLNSSLASTTQLNRHVCHLISADQRVEFHSPFAGSVMCFQLLMEVWCSTFCSRYVSFLPHFAQRFAKLDENEGLRTQRTATGSELVYMKYIEMPWRPHFLLRSFCLYDSRTEEDADRDIDLGWWLADFLSWIRVRNLQPQIYSTPYRPSDYHMYHHTYL